MLLNRVDSIKEKFVADKIVAYTVEGDPLTLPGVSS